MRKNVTIRPVWSADWERARRSALASLDDSADNSKSEGGLVLHMRTVAGKKKPEQPPRAHARLWRSGWVKGGCVVWRVDAFPVLKLKMGTRHIRSKCARSAAASSFCAAACAGCPATFTRSNSAKSLMSTCR